MHTIYSKKKTCIGSRETHICINYTFSWNLILNKWPMTKFTWSRSEHKLIDDCQDNRLPFMHTLKLFTLSVVFSFLI